MSAINIERAGNPSVSGGVRRVLAVDDDPDLLRLLSIRLTAAGDGLTTAYSAAPALGILCQIQNE